MELLYTPRIIRAMEVEKGVPFTKLLEEFSLPMLAYFVQKGMVLNTEDDAYDVIGKYFTEEKGDIVALYLKIVEGLQNAGFLPREMPLAELKAQMTEQMKNLVKNQAPKPQATPEPLQEEVK